MGRPSYKNSFLTYVNLKKANKKRNTFYKTQRISWVYHITISEKKKMNEFNTNVKYFQKFNKYNQNMLE